MKPNQAPHHDALTTLYAPPSAESEDPTMDLFPTTRVRAVGMAAILSGIAFVFVGVQFLLFARSPIQPIIVAIEAIVAGIIGGYFFVAWAVSATRGWSVMCSIGLSLFAGLFAACAFLLSGAASCIVACFPLLATLMLSVVSIEDMRKLARARKAALQYRSAAADTPDGGGPQAQ